MKKWLRVLFAMATGINLALLSTLVAASAADWPTYHSDNTRDANDTADGAFASVTQAWATGTLSGPVYASPLYFQGRVYVATESDDVYAFDGASGAPIAGWPLHLGTAINPSGFPCGDVSPIGITSTPVIDTATGVLYVAGLTADAGASRGYAHHLWAVNVGTRAVQFNVNIDAPGSDPQIQNQRGALALSMGRVYVPFGGRAGDCGLYHGFVVSVLATNGSSKVSWGSTPRSCDGGIWAPGGISVDSAGNVYAATGNAQCSPPGFDFQESVVKLSSTLAVNSWWAPSNWQQLDAGDTDIGSIVPLLLGSSGYVFQSGKNGLGYVLNSASLGGTGAAPVNQHSLGAGGCFGAPAYDGARIYVGCGSGLVAVSYNPTTHDFAPAWTVAAGFAESPIVAGGAVWFQDRHNNLLKAVDPATGTVRFTLSDSGANHFATPAAGGGNVYMPLSNSLVAFRMVTTPSHLYVLDGWGGIHPANGSAPLPYAGYWPGWDIARSLAMLPDGSGGVVLDGWGGVHSVGSGVATPRMSAYWPGWDIARTVTLAGYSTAANPQGWVLDGWGGIHPIGGAPEITFPAYWPGWDIARGMAVFQSATPGPAQGYVLDGWGGIHAFGGAAAVTPSAYWPGWDIARGIVLLPGATPSQPAGYVLDGWGGIHPFGSAPTVTWSAYWPGWDIARGLTMDVSAGGKGGWVLDGWGGLHQFGGAPAPTWSAYWPGWDIARGAANAGTSSGVRRPA